MNEKLRLARIERNLSELDVCSAIGCDLKTYENWELGKHIPQGFWRGKLCEFFGKSLIDLGVNSHHLHTADRKPLVEWLRIW